MRIIITVLFLVYINLTNLLALEQDASSPEQKIIRSIMSITQYSHQHSNNAVWPGYDLTQTPILISFDNGHVFIFNHPASQVEWQTLNIQGSLVQYSPQDLWGIGKTAFNPHFLFEGKSTYLFNMQKAIQDPKKPLHVLVHERFHQYEFEHFNPPPILGNYQDHLNPENLALAKIEEVLLKEYMQSKDEGSKSELLRDYIAVNTMRRLIIQFPSVTWEDHQQVMEGLADYVGYKMAEVLQLVPGFDARRELSQALLKEFRGKDYSDHAIKWRHYSIGAALGYILDDLKIPQWKRRIEVGQASLQQILDEAVPMSIQEIEHRFEKALLTYGYDSLFERVAATTHKFELEIQTMIDGYEQLQGVVVSIGNPGKGLSGSGYNDRMLYLPDGSTLSINDNLQSLSEDNDWQLKLQNIPYLFKKGSGDMEFKVDSSCTIVIDQESYTIKQWISELRQKPFKHVSIKGANIEFVSSDTGGILSVDPHGKILISYDEET